MEQFHFRPNDSISKSEVQVDKSEPDTKIDGKPIHLSIDQQVSLFFCVLFLKDKATIYNDKGVLLQPCLVLLPLSYVRLLTTEVFFSLDETTGVADGPADNLYDRRKV